MFRNIIHYRENSDIVGRQAIYEPAADGDRYEDRRETKITTIAPDGCFESKTEETRNLKTFSSSVCSDHEKRRSFGGRIITIVSNAYNGENGAATTAAVKEVSPKRNGVQRGRERERETVW